MSATAWQDLAREIVRDPDVWIDERDRRRLAPFTRRLFPGYQTAAHIEALCRALEWAVKTPNARLIVTMPPRHSKSLHVSENLPAWFLGNHPDKRVIASSHTAQLAYTFSRRVRNKIASDAYPFPDVRVADDKGAVQAWDIEGRLGGYLAVGVGGSPTGHGGDLIVIDDPIRSAADADSETMRESLWEWWQETIRTRLEPGGSVILTATRWHTDDLTGRLLNAMDAGGEQWRHLHLPAIDEAGEPLWPERWPLESLTAIKSAVGSRAWESQYQGSPVPAEGGTFKRHWWQHYRVLPPSLKRVEILVDSAFKDGVGNDFSVFSLWAQDYADKAYLVRVWRAQVQFPELIKLGHEAHAWAKARFVNNAIPLVVEDKASGQSAIQVWKREYHSGSGVFPALPVVPFSLPPAVKKEQRAEGVTPWIEGGMVSIPGDDCVDPRVGNTAWLDDWLVEHDKFPAGEHDDQVDCTSAALARFFGAEKGAAKGGGSRNYLEPDEDEAERFAMSGRR